MMRKLRLLLTLLALLPAAISATPDKNSELAVLVNESSLLEGVSSAELAKIFRLEKVRSPGGFRYLVAVREPGSPEQNAALAGIYHMTGPEYEKFFLQATFTGRIQAAPRTLARAANVREFIASSPGAISYLRASEVDASVKVLKIDGKSPGDPGYPLKVN